MQRLSRPAAIPPYASWSQGAERFLEASASELPADEGLPYTAYDALQARGVVVAPSLVAEIRLPASWQRPPNLHSHHAFERTILPRIAASTIPEPLLENMKKHMYIDWLLANVYTYPEICDERWFAAVGLWQSVWVLLDDDFETNGNDLRDVLRRAFLLNRDTGDARIDLMAEGIRNIGAIMAPGSSALATAIGEEMMAWFGHARVERALTLHYRRTGAVPDLDAYAMLRAGTVATPACLYIQLAEHRELLGDPDFQALVFHSLLIFGLSNDLVSHHKNEPARMLDALLVLSNGKAVSEAHVRALVDIINRCVAEFERIAMRSRLSPSCLGALRAWTNGCIQWGLHFDRYSRLVPVREGAVEIRCSIIEEPTWPELDRHSESSVC